MESESVKTLTTVQTEFEATAIVSALEAEGIHATAVGGYIAGFKAEVPAGVSVVVNESHLEQAKIILAELKSGGAGVDWSQVDVGGPDDGPA